ncbi:hypothetical protein FB45DRAFT_824005 [Roridomyces roridus]|uniref:Uncharacterized protein n=1 Tax=Roridomyces roridus TaxID=1738132 RepID=A0AAD7FUJ2_9AGAR|nr:hypothetical protein FB45DRAFT_824005 [Roridomyces roridus]
MQQDPTQILELRIHSSSVHLYDESTNEYDSICLLKAPLHEFLRYSREEMSKWLIDLAHDICDPANLRGSLLVWKELSQDWDPVAHTDPLTASVYRYQLPPRPDIFVDLSKISSREGRSVASSGPAQSVTQRDGKCWVTGCLDPRATQICPRRVGDIIGAQILRTFANLEPPPGLSICDGIFRVSLSGALDFWFRDYTVGFRHVSADVYECHLFARDFDSLYTVVGKFATPPPPPPFILPPALHGARAAPPRPQSPNLPARGLFRWHYLQCVINQFAHDDYKSLSNIRIPGLSLWMEGDSDDDDETDSEFEELSNALDLARDVHALQEGEGRR